MRILTNGIMREVFVIKHFKIVNDEYVLYKNDENVSLGLIQENKIMMPDGSKLDVLMKILSNLISPTPNQDINNQNGYVELDKDITATLEEAGYQNVNIPPESLNNLINPSSIPQTNIIETIAVNEVPNVPTGVENQVATPPEQKKEVPKDNRMKIYGIIIVVLVIILVILLFKDKLFKSGGSSSPTPTPIITPEPVVNNTIDTCPNCVFAYYEETKKYIGEDKLVLENYVSNYNELVDANGTPKTIFLGHILDGEGKVERAYVCAVLNGSPFCIEGKNDGSLYNNNKEVLTNIFGIDKCSEVGTGFSCDNGIIIETYGDGNVKATLYDTICQVNNTGDMGCQSRNS